MAVNFVSAGTEGSAANGSVTPGLPAGIAANDILVCLWHTTDQGAGTMAAEWTQAAQANGGGTTSRMGAWWHRYDGVTSPSATVAHTGGQTPIAGIAAFSGCKTTGSPLCVVGTPSGGTDDSIEHLSITPTGTNCMLLVCNGSADDNNRTLPSGYTNVFEDTLGPTNNAFLSTAGNPDGSVSMFYQAWPSGSTGNITVTQSATDAWTSVLLMLEAAATTAFNKTNTEDLSASFADVTSRIVGFVRSTAEDVSASFADTLNRVAGRVRAVSEDVSASFADVLGRVLGVVRGVAEDVAASLEDSITRACSMARSVAEDFSAAFLDALEWARGTIRQLIERL